MKSPICPGVEETTKIITNTKTSTQQYCLFELGWSNKWLVPNGKIISNSD